MELHLLFQTAALALASILIIFLTRFFNQKIATNSKKKHPPQPKGALPIVGHLHLLRTSEPAHIILGNMAETCGPIFSIKLGVHKAIVVSDREIAKECFTTNDIIFANKPKSLLVELMGYNYAMFGLSPYGDYWRKMRKMVNVLLLSQRRIDMLKYIRVPEVRALMNNVYEAWARNKDSEGLDMLHVDIKDLSMNLIIKVVTRTIFGKRFSPSDEEGVRLLGVVRKFFEFFDSFSVSGDFLPYLKFLDLGGHQKQMKTSAKEFDDILEGWLKRHRKQRREEQDEGEQNFIDALSSILQSNSKEEFMGFDHDTILKAACLVILTGSLRPIHGTLTCAISLLINNPEALKTAQKEIDVHVGKERKVEESDITKLVYLQAIIKETMRLYSPPLLPARESMDDCVVAGYNIPKGTRLIINIWKLQNDDSIWSDPNQFRPERFLTTQKDIDFRGHHYEYLPFGSGKRMCAGAGFAVKSLHIILASLVHSFELSKQSNKPIDVSEAFKTSPLEVILNPRLSAHMYHAS